jgi:hypothetical protein
VNGLLPVLLTPVVNLELRVVLKNFKMMLKEIQYQGSWGKLIQEKT